MTKKLSQVERVMHHLKNVGSISPVEAMYLYRIRDLPKRISEIRAASAAELIRKEFKRDAMGQRYVRYYYEAA